MITALAVAALMQVSPHLVLTGVGRWAVFADAATITREGDVARMRALQVAEADFTAGDRAYWGGWSWWRFDCAARTGQRLDFAAITIGGDEGPAMPIAGSPEALAPGGDAAELAAVACATQAATADAVSVETAVTLGRARLAN